MRFGTLRKAGTRHGLGAAALAAGLLGAAMFMAGPAEGLAAINAGLTVVVTGVFGALAVGYLLTALADGREAPWRIAVQAVVLVASVLAVWSRGAPHNNPLLYAAYEYSGALGLLAGHAVLAALMLAGGVAGFLLARGKGGSEPESRPAPEWWRGSGCLRPIVAGLIAVTALAALEPVVRWWDVSGWGDAIYYDVIAHSIARGDMPAGHSYYMPVYPFGMAILYYVFGHFFFVQQIANVLLAAAAIVLLCLAAWNVFRSGWAVLFVGVLAAFNDNLRHAPHLTQIENWYVPVFCLTLYAASCYFRRGSPRTLVFLGLSIGLAFNTRTQAAFFLGVLLLSPLLLRARWLYRLRHFVVLAAIFFAMLAPWTIRNYVHDGRLWPVGTQGIEHMAVSNDARVFHGIRRDLGAAEIAREWVQRYPDRTERLEAMRRDVIDRLVRDPGYFLGAVPWRTLAFYGLLPPGVWAPNGPQPTDWSAELPNYLLKNLPILSLLAASVLGLLVRPGRTTLFLLAAIAGNLGIVIFVGFSEPRLSYPVLVLHMLLAACALFAPRLEFAPAAEAGGGAPRTRAPPWRWGAAMAAAAVLLATSYWTFGRPNLYRTLKERAVVYNQEVALDTALPDLSRSGRVEAGQRGRLTVAATNVLFPVKYYAHPLEGFPEFTTDPSRENYYRAYFLDASGTYDWGTSRHVGISFFGAQLDQPIREEDVIEIEGEVLGVNERGNFWLSAEKVRLVERRGKPGG